MAQMNSCLRPFSASSVTDATLRYWVGNELVKTRGSQTHGEIRKKHADMTAPAKARSA